MYATFGQGQVAAWTLDGKRVWGTWLARSKGGSAHCDHIPSPVLADGVLLVNQDHKTLVGLDAKTGKQLWKWTGETTGGSYSVGSTKVVRLAAPGGKTVSVAVMLMGGLVRVSDGKLVGDLQHEMQKKPNWSSGPSITGHDNVILKGGSGGAYTAYRLETASADAVTATKLYDLGANSSPGFQGHALGEIVFFSNGAVRDFATGKPLTQWSRNTVPTMQAGNNNLIVGHHLILVDSSDDQPSHRYGQFVFVDLAQSPPAVLKGVNLLVWSKPRNPVMEKYAKELYDLPYYSNNSAGYPHFFSNVDTSFTAHGDSLYVRSTSHLYRIGASNK